MARGRKTRFKIPYEEVRKYILDNILKEDGYAMSYREFWNSPKFQLDTGMRGDKRNNYKVSEGTITYHMKKTLKLTERDIYDYHVKITNRIDEENMPFDKWSKKHNKGKNKKIVSLDFDKLFEESRWKFLTVCLRLARWIDFGEEPDNMMTDFLLKSFNKNLKFYYEINGYVYEDYFHDEWKNLMKKKDVGDTNG